MRTDARLTREIESRIISEGADAVGFAPVERFKNAPSGYRPQDYMPDASGVISLAIHIPDGVCDVWGHYSEPGKSVGPYLFYGYGLINLEMSRIASLVARMLENRGYKSLVFPPTWAISVYRWRGLKDGEMKADFSHRHAAVAAGLGELGWNGLAMTPAFGPRVRFNSIITNAPLGPSPMYQGPPICQPERCRYLCVGVCPTAALSRESSKKATIGGRDFEYTKIDMVRCSYGVMGLVKGSGSYGAVEIPPGPGNAKHYREALEQQHPYDKLMLESSHGIIGGDYCGRCLHQCPAHLYVKTGAKPRKARAAARKVQG